MSVTGNTLLCAVGIGLFGDLSHRQAPAPGQALAQAQPLTKIRFINTVAGGKINVSYYA